MQFKTIANNKKAFHDYNILERLEAGLALVGSEVKSIRLSRVNLKDSFIRIIKDEAFVFGMHISYLSTVNASFAMEEKRPRKLLLHKKQILKLHFKIKTDQLTIVPLSLYFNSRNIAKLSIGLAKGLKKQDKRELLKRKENERSMQRAIKTFNRK